MVLLLLIFAVVFALIGALTVAKWLLVVALALCVVAVVASLVGRNRTQL